LGQITNDTQSLSAIIDNVSTSASEQASGIDQINLAVAQLDSITQSNAANAEESSAASQELHAQAASLHEVAGSLLEIVNGAKPPSA
jgi:methyl-accepting chemotaxis protein